MYYFTTSFVQVRPWRGLRWLGGKIMKILTAWFLAFAAAVPALPMPALAQTPPAELGARYVPAPWWMREPVIASIGHVRTELLANRASFSAQFSSVERTAERATEAAAARIRDLDKTLRAFGAERIRLVTTFTTRPLYEQYREKEGGRLVDNQRADKIERYEVRADIRIDVRDIGVLESSYATVLAAKPTSVQSVHFSLEPDNRTKAWLYSEAVKDAARRAQSAAQAAGSRLGSVKVIDPTGRACKTDVLAGWPSYAGTSVATNVEYSAPPLAVARTQMAARQAEEEPVLLENAQGASVRTMHVTLQPPLHELTGEACVVYALQ